MNAFYERIYEQQHRHTKIAQASIFLVLACASLSLQVHAALHLRAGACLVLPKGETEGWLRVFIGQDVVVGGTGFCIGGGLGMGGHSTLFNFGTPQAYGSLAHSGTSPRPRPAVITDAILRKGLGEIGSCAIPEELWPEGLEERVRRVDLSEGRGYPSPIASIVLEALVGKGVFKEVRPGDGRGGTQLHPICYPQEPSQGLMDHAQVDLSNAFGCSC